MINTAKGITKGQIHVLFNERLKTSGASVLPFSFTVTVTAGQTVDLSLSAHTGKIAKVQWGDGKETTVSYSGNSFESHKNIYAVAGTYTIKIADSDNLKFFRIEKPDYSVDIVGALPLYLIRLTLNGNSINWNHTGALPVNLTFIYIYGNSINWNHTGALPVNMTYIQFIGNSINWSYSAQAYKSTLTSFRYLPGVTGKWSSVMVDQVIKDLAASTMAGEVNIAGNNEARTSASDQDLIDLRANGATVTVNEY